jgi:hypothetical protein
MALQIPAYADDQRYPAWYRRKQFASVATAGVINPSTDFIITPSSGLQVQASAGGAYVQQTVCTEDGGNSFYNGLYEVFNDAPVNPSNTIAAPISNPRIDQIILQVLDIQEQGLSGASKAQLLWLEGSESASASLGTMGPGLSNPGAAALPANSLCRAYVLQTVGESSISSGNILNVLGPSVGTVVVGPNQTVALPSPTAGLEISIQASSSVSGSSPATVSGTNIQGVGLSSASSFLLGMPGASVVIRADGTNWRIIQGCQDTGWIALTLLGGTTQQTGAYTASARLQGDTVKFKGQILNGGGLGFANNVFSVPTSMVNTETGSSAAVGVLGYANIGGTPGVGAMTASPGSATFVCRFSWESGGYFDLTPGTYTIS